MGYVCGWAFPQGTVRVRATTPGRRGLSNPNPPRKLATDPSRVMPCGLGWSYNSRSSTTHSGGLISGHAAARLEETVMIANHASTRLYGWRTNEVSLDEVERILNSAGDGR